MILKVQSETNPAITYDVTVVNGVAVACSCPSARWHTGKCKHVRGVNDQQERICFLARRARYQVLAPVNIALMDSIHATASKGVGHNPTAAQIAALAEIVGNIAADPWSDIERGVLGGLLTALTALTANDVNMPAAA